MSIGELYKTIEEELRAGNPIAQATVIETRGSTPRKQGATMLVRNDGRLVGTIGGGCGEADVIRKARLSLLDGKTREELADLTEEISTESEAVCGGTLRVFIEAWQPTPENIALAEDLAGYSSRGEFVVVHRIVGDESGRAGKGPPREPSPLLAHRAVTDARGQALRSTIPGEIPLPPAPTEAPHALQSLEGLQFFIERWDPAPTLVIVGAGHIAEPLESLARMTGFRTVVIDDRRAFANRERFPRASAVEAGPILDVCRRIELSPHHYLVLVTRGHVLDMDALRVFVERAEPVAYIGMIGSRRRVNAVFDLLEEEGYPRESFTHVRAPVGLSIGAETPAEIAVSIMAEVIAQRRRSGEDTRPLTQLSGRHPSLRRASLAEGD